MHLCYDLSGTEKGSSFTCIFIFFFFSPFFKILIGWVLVLVFFQRKPTTLSIWAGVLKEKEPCCLMKEVFIVMHIGKEIIGYALPCIILSVISGIKDILLSI